MLKVNSFIVVLSLLIVSCNANSQDNSSVSVKKKVKGLNYTGPASGPIPSGMISSMEKIGANYIALVPEATLYRQNLKVSYNRSGGWFGESMEATLQGIKLARENGLKVMIKPHIAVGYDRSGFTENWPARDDSAALASFRKKYRAYISKQPDKLVSDESWRGAVMTKSESDWKTLTQNYTDFILDYARLADSLSVEMFCIGTEMKAMALEKPDYWHSLIKQVQEVYDGELTYAANWDSYNKIAFWDDLDYIGIDAYFPLGPGKSPDMVALWERWQPYKNEIQNLSQKYQKPVLFTEWGYENENFAAEMPWQARGRETEDGGPHNRDHLNDELQATLYEATFQTFWDEPWFAGVFVWRWSPPEELNRGIPTYNYSPIGKPAEDTLKKWFRRN